jgi:hypothetical protein
VCIEVRSIIRRKVQKRAEVARVSRVVVLSKGEGACLSGGPEPSCRGLYGDEEMDCRRRAESS